MNTIHIKALFLAGLQSWLSDRRTIFMRLFLWPNLLPFLFLFFIMIALGIMLLRTVPSGSISTSTVGVTYSIYGDQKYITNINNVFTAENLHLRYIALKNDEVGIHEAITSKKIAFALNIRSSDDGNLEIAIVYDRSRDYIHKKWVDDIKSKGPEIALEIRKKRFDANSTNIDKKTMAFALAPINLKVTPYGNSNGAMAGAIIVFFLWGVLLVAPLDTSASIASSQMLTDTNEDFISIWKSAGVLGSDIIIGRFLSALAVFILALIVYFIYVYTWSSLYILFTGYLVGLMSESQLSNENFYIITIGFQKLVDSIHIQDVIYLFIMLASTGSVLIMLRLKLSLYINDLEQVRTRLKPFEILLSNLPIVGLLMGTITQSFYVYCVPILNQLVAMQYFFKGGMSLMFLLVGVSANIFFMILIYLNTQKHVGNQNRIILNSTV